MLRSLATTRRCLATHRLLSHQKRARDIGVQSVCDDDAVIRQSTMMLYAIYCSSKYFGIGNTQIDVKELLCFGEHYNRCDVVV